MMGVTVESCGYQGVELLSGCQESVNWLEWWLESGGGCCGGEGEVPCSVEVSLDLML